jgi:hypothetical protein
VVGVVGHLVELFYVSFLVCAAFFDIFRGWLRILFEILDISLSHSFACKCSAMTIVCACVGRVLYV